MTQLLATISLNPAAQIEVPSTYAQTDAALAYWLSNPLLPEGRIAATQERLPFMNKAEKQALVLRIKQDLEKRRGNQSRDTTAYSLLLQLLRHELVSKEERVAIKPHLCRLVGAELDWEYARIEAAIKLRETAMYDNAEAA
jgi:hypothetical protein